MQRPSFTDRLGRRMLVASVLVTAIIGGARLLNAQNQSVDGQDACSLSCRDSYQNCKNGCDPGDTSCTDGCASTLSQCLSNCN